MSLPPFSWILISFENDERLFRALEHVVAPTLRAWERRGSPLDVEILIVDNSPDSPGHASFVERLERTWREAVLAPTKFLAAPRNLSYAGAINAAVRHASRDFVVYTCSNHCTYHSENWIEGLLEPFALHPDIAMTGSLFSSPPARLFGLPPVAPIHVQGGIFAARTDLLAVLPYDELNDPHLHSDIRQSYRITAAGHELYPARSVRSLPVGSDERHDPLGLVHDYAGQAPFCRNEYRYQCDGEKGHIAEVHSLSARDDLHRKLGLP